MVGIYKIVNPLGEVYIGLSTNIEKRFQNYFCNNCKRQGKLSKSLEKHGVYNHEFIIIEECDIEYIRDREKYWIKYYNSCEKGLNSNPGGGGVLEVSEETKCKISNWRKENPQIFTDKVIINMRNSRPNKKKVFQYSLDGEFIKEWKSMNDAARGINVTSSDCIYLCIKNKQQSGYGFQWFDSKQDFVKPIKKYQKPNSWNGNKNKQIDLYIESIQEEYKNGDNVTKIAKKYNVHRDVIRKRLNLI